jgi:type IX secretion system PorP/SprF family membrane protein
LLFGTVTYATFGQDFHFSRFIPNMVYVNPACTALPESGEFELVYRNQWPGISATFVTYGASLIMPVKSLGSGFGVQFINDVQAEGVITRTSAALTYGYMIEINRYWKVGAGLSASWIMKKFNADKLLFRSDLLNDLGYGYDPVIIDNYSKNYADFSLGIIAKNNNDFAFGISAGHVTRPHDVSGSAGVNRLPLKYSAFMSGSLTGNDQFITRSIGIRPAIMYSYQHHNNELIWGSDFTFASNFMAGVWMRQNTNFNFDAMIISLGISYEKYNIDYSYDVNLKKINFLSTKMAAHEVTFLYRFEYKERKYKKIKCPAY